MANINQLVLETNLWRRDGKALRDSRYAWLIKEIPKPQESERDHSKFNLKSMKNKENNPSKRTGLKTLHQQAADLPPSQRWPNWSKLSPGDL